MITQFNGICLILPISPVANFHNTQRIDIRNAPRGLKNTTKIGYHQRAVGWVVLDVPMETHSNHGSRGRGRSAKNGDAGHSYNRFITSSYNRFIYYFKQYVLSQPVGNTSKEIWPPIENFRSRSG